MTVFERIRSIIVDHLNVKPGQVTETASFVDDLGADSLDAVELLMAFEDEFDLIIADEDAEHCLIVGDAVKYITRATAW